MSNRENILYETRPATINALLWTGNNQREMFDFLTDYKMKDEYMTVSGDHFIIDHGMVNGGLVLRSPNAPTTTEIPVNIGEYVVKFGGEFFPMKPSLFTRVFELVQ